MPETYIRDFNAFLQAKMNNAGAAVPAEAAALRGEVINAPEIQSRALASIPAQLEARMRATLGSVSFSSTLAEQVDLEYNETISKEFTPADFELSLTAGLAKLIAKFAKYGDITHVDEVTARLAQALTTSPENLAAFRETYAKVSATKAELERRREAFVRQMINEKGWSRKQAMEAFNKQEMDKAIEECKEKEAKAKKAAKDQQQGGHQDNPVDQYVNQAKLQGQNRMMIASIALLLLPLEFVTLYIHSLNMQKIELNKFVVKIKALRKEKADLVDVVEDIFELENERVAAIDAEIAEQLQKMEQIKANNHLTEELFESYLYKEFGVTFKIENYIKFSGGNKPHHEAASEEEQASLLAARNAAAARPSPAATPALRHR